MYRIHLAVTLAVVLAVSMTIAPAVFAASHITDAKGDTANPNFDIQQAGFDDSGVPYIKVIGSAGGTPSGTGCSPAYAYVFAFTNGDHYAVASHDCFSDSNEGNGGSDWHAHKIFVSTNTGGTGHFACLTGATDDGTVSLNGHRVSLQGTTENDLDHVATVRIVGGAPAGDCPVISPPGAAIYVDVLDLAS